MGRRRGLPLSLDKRELAAARCQVERAKLEASRQAIVSVLQGEESEIDLASRRRKAACAGGDGQSASEIRRRKNYLVQRPARAPLTGVVTYLSNYSQGWMNAQPFNVVNYRRAIWTLLDDMGVVVETPQVK